jgi:hypothetical protein
LATAIDGWQSGFGISATDVGTPSVDEIDHIMWAGWERSVLVGAQPARSGPF